MTIAFVVDTKYTRRRNQPTPQPSGFTEEFSIEGIEMRAVMRQQKRNESAQDLMVRRHLPLVYHLARKVHNSLGAAVQLDDLVSAGSVGLVEAVETFDHRRGLAFSTFAAPRIRGAILDDMRKSDLLSR